MKDYYTLIELLAVLQIENSEIMKKLTSLNVLMKFKSSVNSFDYDFDYCIDSGIKIKCIRKNNSGFDKIIFGLKNQNESLIEKNENGNYQLSNNNIGYVSDVYQKYFNEVVESILKKEFTNMFFLESDFSYKDGNYHIVITPLGVYVKRKKDNKVDCELVFDAKSNILNCKITEPVTKNSSIFRIKIPKNIFKNEMISIIERIILGLSQDELSVDSLHEIENEYNYSSFIFCIENHKQLNKKI